MEQSDKTLRALVLSARRVNSILERYLSDGIIWASLPARCRMELELLKHQLDEFMRVSVEVGQ